MIGQNNSFNNNNDNENDNNNNLNNSNNRRRNSLTYISNNNNDDNNNNNSNNGNDNQELAGGGNHTLTEYEYRDADYESDRGEEEEEEEEDIISINQNSIETKSLLSSSSVLNNSIAINENPIDINNNNQVILTIKDDNIINTITATTTTTTTSTTIIKKHKKPQGMCYDGRRNYILTVDAIIAVIFAPIVYFTYYIPNLELDHKDEYYKYWYYNIPFGKYVLWMLCIIGGFAYVSIITEKRSVPFHCRYKRHRDFFQLLFAATLWFAVGGPSRALLGRDDFIVGLDDHVTKNTTDGYSAEESFFYNYFAFFLSFLLGLHFTYLDRNLFLRSMGDKFGTPMLWKTFKVSELLALIPVLLFILSMAGLHIYLIIADKLWEYFAIAYGIFFFILIGVSVLFRKTHYLHMHHYFIFGSLIPLTGFQTVLSLISLGAISGIATEGVARWSMGWLWYRGSRVL